MALTNYSKTKIYLNAKDIIGSIQIRGVYMVEIKRNYSNYANVTPFAAKSGYALAKCMVSAQWDRDWQIMHGNNY